MQAAGWYDDPTGRHEFRYWRPGWTDLAADGPDEVTDPLRPRWTKILGLCLLAQLVLLPIIGFAFIHESAKPDSRAGIMLAADEAGRPQIVYAPCSGERLRHIVLSKQAGKGEPVPVWAVKGDVAPGAPITIGSHVDGMKTKQKLDHPLAPDVDFTLLVSSNQLQRPQKLAFTVSDIPASGVLSFNGTYADESAFRSAALDNAPCGVEHNKLKRVLGIVLALQLVAAAAGVALLLLPRYPGPASPYAKQAGGRPTEDKPTAE